MDNFSEVGFKALLATSIASGVAIALIFQENLIKNISYRGQTLPYLLPSMNIGGIKNCFLLTVLAPRSGGEMENRSIYPSDNQWAVLQPLRNED